jgi:hypothetical protein
MTRIVSRTEEVAWGWVRAGSVPQRPADGGGSRVNSSDDPEALGCGQVLDEHRECLVAAEATVSPAHAVC